MGGDPACTIGDSNKSAMVANTSLGGGDSSFGLRRGRAEPDFPADFVRDLRGDVGGPAASTLFSACWADWTRGAALEGRGGVCGAEPGENSNLDGSAVVEDNLPARSAREASGAALCFADDESCVTDLPFPLVVVFRYFFRTPASSNSGLALDFFDGEKALNMLPRFIVMRYKTWRTPG